MNKVFFRVFLFSLFALLVFISIAHQEEQLTKSSIHQSVSAFTPLPLYFVENRGQVDDSVEFHARTSRGNVYFTSQGITYQFFYPKDSGEETRVNNIVMCFAGANETVKVEGLEKGTARMSYFRGGDPEKWVRGAQSYQDVIYRELYPRIDLLVYGKGDIIKHEYRVKTGGKVEDIRIQYQGVEDLRVNERGQLEIMTADGVTREDAPFSYQTIDGQKARIATEYRIEKENTVQFMVGEYRRDHDLVIDPDLLYSTFIGGKAWEGAFEMTYDKDGNALFTGATWSSNFPTTGGAYDLNYNGGGDVFVSKLDPEGRQLLFSTFLGGNDSDSGDGISVDSEGNVYVAGETESNDFPTTRNAYDRTFNGGDDDFFAAILSPDGDKLLYSTFIGGSRDDEDVELDIVEENESSAVGKSGTTNYATMYILGETDSVNFPVTPGAYDTTHNGEDDIVVVCLDAQGNLDWSTFLGGSKDEDPIWIEIDGEGNVHVTGYTESTNYPTSNKANDKTHNGRTDTVVTKLDPQGENILASTYFGGSRDDRSESVAVDSEGNVYVAGETNSNNIPTTFGAYDPVFNGGNDGFIAKFDSNLENLIFSTYLGGSGEEEVEEMVIAEGKNAAADDGEDADKTVWIYLTGDTDSTNFPTTPDAYQKALNRDQDAYLTRMSGDGSTIDYSTYMGGRREDDSGMIAVDSKGNCYIGGWTESSDFPTTKKAYDKSINGDRDAWVAKFKFPAIYNSLSGNVTDKATGLPIAKVKVKLKGRTDKKVKKTTKADKQGNYMFDDLDPGVYKVWFIKSGYKRHQNKKLTVDGPTVYDGELIKK